MDEEEIEEEIEEDSEQSESSSNTDSDDFGCQRLEEMFCSQDSDSDFDGF